MYSSGDILHMTTYRYCSSSTNMLSPKQEVPSAAPEQRWMSGDLLELQEQLLGKQFERNLQDVDVSSATLIDAMLAKEFSKLSVQERSKTYEELHGVDQGVIETPAYIENYLRQLDDEVSKIRTKSAYDLAKQQNNAYVTDLTFRIMFLRASGFHPRNAAIRMVGYFEGMLEYFGEKHLKGRIRFSDLDRDDQACVKAGQTQILPSRDQSGRAILLDTNTFQDQSYVTATNRLKAFIYFWLMLAEDEENQKRGVVLILMQMGSLDMKRASLPVSRDLPRLLSWVPLRVCAQHCCSDNAVSGGLFRTALLGVPADIRGRTRFHNGTYTQIMYSLLGFGIPIDLFPFTPTGTIKKTGLNRWIAKHIARDTDLTYGGAFPGVDLPSRNDVLLGRGKPIQHHTGNAYLRVHIESHTSEYQAAHLAEDKIYVVYKVFSTIKARSGRFLKKGNDGWWHESPDVDAVDTVRKAFQRRTNMNETHHGKDRPHAAPNDGDDYVSMFQHQGKRPKFDPKCCGT